MYLKKALGHTRRTKKTQQKQFFRSGNSKVSVLITCLFFSSVKYTQEVFASQKVSVCAISDVIGISNRKPGFCWKAEVKLWSTKSVLKNPCLGSRAYHTFTTNLCIVYVEFKITYFQTLILLSPIQSSRRGNMEDRVWRIIRHGLQLVWLQKLIGYKWRHELLM